MVTMLFFSSLAFTALENAMLVIFIHRVAIRRRRFLVPALLPYFYVLCLGLRLLVVTLRTEENDLQARPKFIGKFPVRRGNDSPRRGAVPTVIRVHIRRPLPHGLASYLALTSSRLRPTGSPLVGPREFIGRCAWIPRRARWPRQQSSQRQRLPER
jgi:hypothetical protein